MPQLNKVRWQHTVDVLENILVVIMHKSFLGTEWLKLV